MNRIRQRTNRGVAVATLTTALISGVLTAVPAYADAQILVDPQSLGSITLLDATGKVITGGSTQVPLKSLFTVAKGSGPNPSEYNQYSALTLWVPVQGSDESQWSGAPLSLSTPHSLAEANDPATVTTIDGGSISRDLIEASGPSKGAYANLYQMRLYGIEDGPADSPMWYTSIIQVDPAKQTWKIVGQGGSGVPASTVPAGSVGSLLPTPSTTPTATVSKLPSGAASTPRPGAVVSGRGVATGAARTPVHDGSAAPSTESETTPSGAVGNDSPGATTAPGPPAQNLTASKATTVEKRSGGHRGVIVGLLAFIVALAAVGAFVLRVRRGRA